MSDGYNEKHHKEHMKQMAKRLSHKKFKEIFNKRFLVEAAKHPMGTVDTDKLSKEIIAELGIKDPAVDE